MSIPIPNTPVLTANEAASYLKVHPQVLEKYLRQGAVPARKVGRQWRISKFALDLWLAPELSALLPRVSAWNEIFSLGDTIGAELRFTDETIKQSVMRLRRPRRTARDRRP